MGAEIANVDYNLQVTNTIPGAATPDGSTSDTPGKFKMNGSNVAVNSIGWSPSGCTLASHTFVSGASDGVIATALKVKSDSKAVMRKGDIGVCAGSFTLTASPYTPMPCACSLEVNDAGQIKVRAE